MLVSLTTRNMCWLWSSIPFVFPCGRNDIFCFDVCTPLLAPCSLPPSWLPFTLRSEVGSLIASFYLCVPSHLSASQACYLLCSLHVCFLCYSFPYMCCPSTLFSSCSFRLSVFCLIPLVSVFVGSQYYLSSDIVVAVLFFVLLLTLVQFICLVWRS